MYCSVDVQHVNKKLKYFDLVFDESKFTLKFRRRLSSFRDEFHLGDEVKGDFVRHIRVLSVVGMGGDKLANPSSSCY